MDDGPVHKQIVKRAEISSLFIFEKLPPQNKHSWEKVFASMHFTP